MRTKPTSKQPKKLPPLKSAGPIDVEAELAAIERAYKKASRSKATARAFLVRAGILNKNGNLAKKYR